MKYFKPLFILSGLACLTSIGTAQGNQVNNVTNSVMSSPIYAQRMILSDASGGKVLAYFTHIQCKTCISPAVESRDFYLKYVLPPVTESGKIFATFRILPQCYYDISLSFSIDTTGQFILPTGRYLSTPDSRNAANCPSAPAMSVLNVKDVTYIAWG